MIQRIIRCDICNKELSVTRVTAPIGEIDVVETGKTEVCDTRHLFQHICKECALKIDNELLKFKLKVLGDK